MAFNVNRNRPIVDINVTPLVDVMLVLLIIFMITAPLMFNGMDLTLPKTKEVNRVNLTTSQVVLSVTASGEYYIGKQKFLYTELINVLQSKLKESSSKTVFLRADYQIIYGKIAKLMSYLKSNGINNLSLVTETEEKND